jgi:hypothetical protein
MEGHLLVREDKSGLVRTTSTWQKRWVVLIRNELTIFEGFNQTADAPFAKLRSVRADGCEVIEGKDDKKEPFGFEVKHPQRDSVFLRADDDQGRTTWSTALNNASAGEPPGHRASANSDDTTAGYTSATFSCYVKKTDKGLGLKLLERRLPGMTSVGIVVNPQEHLTLAPAPGAGGYSTIVPRGVARQGAGQGRQGGRAGQVQA